MNCRKSWNKTFRHTSDLFVMLASVCVDCRHAMLPVMLNHINDLMMYRFELELCIRIISDIVDLLFKTDRLVLLLALINCSKL